MAPEEMVHLHTDVWIPTQSEIKAQFMQRRHLIYVYIKQRPRWSEDFLKPPQTSKAESQAHSHCKLDHTATVTPLNSSTSHCVQA